MLRTWTEQDSIEQHNNILKLLELCQKLAKAQKAQNHFWPCPHTLKEAIADCKTVNAFETPLAAWYAAYLANTIQQPMHSPWAWHVRLKDAKVPVHDLAVLKRFLTQHLSGAQVHAVYPKLYDVHQASHSLKKALWWSQQIFKPTALEYYALLLLPHLRNRLPEQASLAAVQTEIVAFGLEAMMQNQAAFVRGCPVNVSELLMLTPARLGAWYCVYRLKQGAWPELEGKDSYRLYTKLHEQALLADSMPHMLERLEAGLLQADPSLQTQPCVLKDWHQELSCLLEALIHIQQKQSRPVTPQTVRILIVGDSAAAGFGIEGREQRWVAQMEALFQAKGIALEIANASYVGDKIFDGLQRAKQALNFLKPDLVLITLGGNDAYSQIRIDHMLHHADQLVRLCKAHANEVIWGMGLPQTFKITPHYREVFYRTLSTLKIQHNIAVHLLPEEMTEPQHILPDKIHFNHASQQHIACFGFNILQDAVLRLAKQKGCTTWLPIFNAYSVGPQATQTLATTNWAQHPAIQEGSEEDALNQSPRHGILST